ncbi:16S rRNA (guanine(966)-N(2))-methyltransferase RsmD [Falsibacillus albus]|uniref:16S rRNA (Guanine(966)-N(2))-methyltransferase RsmD n=1 Tax=Falsibacillus albus TaxID=2478915 RepID=A0A3L7JYN3_9BACI|nr:16S rRNA (guanine(966)-N(2))-methyltransferase RsmD [Falsibacillus albus]RLQ95853.1 16S rRNA (guanine(966)-N(2))-methyltransferase RsmD [Falsibacillus albus]
MRVISGTCKGRPLKSVSGNQTRPTTDKVKESIFNMIGPYFEGGHGLDLFAGSGGLGIEALSRGFEHVIFVDRDNKAFQTIRTNIGLCGFEECSEVYKNDAERALRAVVKREIAFDGIFLDPPYKKQQLTKILSSISKHNLLNENGYIVCEHSSDIILPREIDGLKMIRNETYGLIGVSIYTLAKTLMEGKD